MSSQSGMVPQFHEIERTQAPHLYDCTTISVIGMRTQQKAMYEPCPENSKTRMWMHALWI